MIRGGMLCTNLYQTCEGNVSSIIVLHSSTTYQIMNYQYFVNVQMTQLPMLGQPQPFQDVKSKQFIRVHFNLIKSELCGYPGDNQRRRVTFIFIIANINQFTFSFFAVIIKSMLLIIIIIIIILPVIIINNNKKKKKLFITIEYILYNTQSDNKDVGFYVLVIRVHSFCVTRLQSIKLHQNQKKNIYIYIIFRPKINFQSELIHFVIRNLIPPPSSRHNHA